MARPDPPRRRGSGRLRRYGLRAIAAGALALFVFDRGDPVRLPPPDRPLVPAKLGAAPTAGTAVAAAGTPDRDAAGVGLSGARRKTARRVRKGSRRSHARRRSHRGPASAVGRPAPSPPAAAGHWSVVEDPPVRVTPRRRVEFTPFR